MPVTHLDRTERMRLAADLGGALPPLDADGERIAVSLYRLLAEGSPVGAEALARAAALPVELVRERLAGWPGVFRDGAGEVTGFWGLTVSRTPPHAFQVGTAHLWTWCSWDTLFIPAVLGRSARVESVCSTTGQRIVLTVGPDGVLEVSPPETVISFLRPQAPFDGDMILTFCHHVLFFSSPDAGERWMVGREGAMLLSLEQGFDIGARMVGQKFATVGIASTHRGKP